MEPGVAPVADATRQSLLRVRDLQVAFGHGRSRVRVVKGVDLDIAPGELVALVGESGSGKSVTVRSLARLVPGATVSGEVTFDGGDVASLGRKGLQRMRGSGMAMVFQDPLSSLNPTVRIIDQVAEVERIGGVGRRAAADHARHRLAQVGLDADRVARQYPFELSGGMRQRVAIAIALSGRPKLLVADEPTTALDVRVQAQVLELMRELALQERTAVLLVSHDLAVVAHFATRVAVMYAGRIVEQGPTEALFARPQHPYTRGLLASVPRVDRPRQDRLEAMPGDPPSPGDEGAGCAFASRCVLAVDRCHTERPVLRVVADPDLRAGPGRVAACHRAGEVPLVDGRAERASRG